MALQHKNWQVIINPASGNGNALKRWNKTERWFDRSFDSVVCERPGHLRTIVEEALTAGTTNFIAVGGDGTHHELVNGLLSNQLDSTRALYALLPAGTGNDWAKAWRIPLNSRKWAMMLKNGNSFVQDAGKVTCEYDGMEVCRYFANMTGIGYGADVVRQLKDRSQGRGRLKYLMAGLGSLRQWTPKMLELVIDGEVHRGRLFLVQVGINGYAGGGMHFAPHAQPDDGLLACTVVGDISRAEVLRNIPRLYSGSIGKVQKVTLHAARQIRISHTSGEEPVWVECDGELIGHTPVTLTVRQQSLRFVRP